MVLIMQVYVDEVGNNDVKDGAFLVLIMQLYVDKVGNSDVNRWNVFGLNYAIVR